MLLYQNWKLEFGISAKKKKSGVRTAKFLQLSGVELCGIDSGRTLKMDMVLTKFLSPEKD